MRFVEMKDIQKNKYHKEIQMKSPKDMRIIEIDITNACIHQCSNCTRFCGHHKKPFFMDLESVKRAIDSLEGFGGTIGIIGGEPTLHPQFEEIANYLASKFPKNKGTDRQLLHPQKDFLKTIKDVEAAHSASYYNGVRTSVRLKGPGLLSAMGNSYAKHYEVIQDVFKFQLLNDHINPMYHDPILVSRKELGIPDEEWRVLRDNCWIQNQWSASITPKGAFFCEVAGTLDLLFDGPGGWEVEPNWWKREVSDFSDQLHWCELCGMACETYTRNAKDEIDDASPLLYEKLKEIGSKKLENGQINLIDISAEGQIAEHSKTSVERFGSSMPYADSYASKFSVKDSKLFPKQVEAVVYITHDGEAKWHERYTAQFDMTYFIFDTKERLETAEIPENANCKAWTKTDQEQTHRILKNRNTGTYIAVFSDGISAKSTFVASIKQLIFNSGTLLYATEIQNNVNALEWIDVQDDTKEGAFLFFSPTAYSLRDTDDKLHDLQTLFDLKSIWKTEKMIPIDAALYPKVSADRIKKGTRYAMYGTGAKAIWDIACIKEKEGIVALVVDSDTKKHGTAFEGIVIAPPQALLEKKEAFDVLVISSHLYYAEIEETLCNMGFDKNELMYI